MIDREQAFFDFAAEVGLTKHIGGVEATDALIALCHVGPDSAVLDVLFRMMRLYARSPAYRRFVKEVSAGGLTPQNLDEYFGYGLYVGRK